MRLEHAVDVGMLPKLKGWGLDA